LRSALFIFNSIAELVEWILRNNYSIWDLQHYLDDYITAGPQGRPNCYQNLAIASSVCQRSVVPLHPDKSRRVYLYWGLNSIPKYFANRLLPQKLQELKLVLAGCGNQGNGARAWNLNQ
jgi:hypothetical protein